MDLYTRQTRLCAAHRHAPFPKFLMFPRGSEPAIAPLRWHEFVDYPQSRLSDRHEQQLRYAFAHSDGVRLRAAIPARDHQRALVVRIDHTYQIAHHEPVFVTQP